VRQTGVLGERTLRFSQVGTFSYSATHQYNRTEYTGTLVQMRFRPLPGESGRGISFDTIVQIADQDLDMLRDLISRGIADRMARTLAEAGTATWTKNLRFRNDGIEYAPLGIFGRKRLFLPNEDYGGWIAKGARFYLFKRGTETPIMFEELRADNFYPGLTLLVDRFGDSEQEGA
jgi:hypothetical protein